MYNGRPTALPSSIKPTIGGAAELQSLRRWLVAPTLGLLLFLGLMTSAFFYAQESDQEQQQQALVRDLEWAQQALKIRWQTHTESVSAAALEWSRATYRELGEAAPPGATLGAPTQFLQRNPEVAWVGAIDPKGTVQWVLAQSTFATPNTRIPGMPLEDSTGVQAWRSALVRRGVAWSKPFNLADGNVLIELHIPIVRSGVASGSIFIGYPLSRLFSIAMADESRQRYKLEFLDSERQALASTSMRSAGNPTFEHEILLEPPGHELRLKAYGYEPKPQRLERLLYGAVMTLSILILASLGLLWRAVRLRMLAEAQRDHSLGQTLAEAAFRRAMEDSMLTGMRAFDNQGRITYVNRAFCRMTGFDAEELVGKVAPFPYWTDDEVIHQAAALQKMLAGQVSPAGIEVRLKRRDGGAIDTRMYVSPLIDHNGEKVGWMTSVTDITEPRRIRGELAAAQDRFTTVLDELDAAVSVLGLDNGDAETLLFANPMYRQLFGSDPCGHQSLRAAIAAPQADKSATEVWSHETQRWFEVRTRPIRWVDGRQVEIQVATDITNRRFDLERQRRQDEKLAHTSRLITMGEMASSLAHEINQPLAAISNYVSGLTARLRDRALKGQSMDREELIDALAKTGRQAERAAEVIRRIRGFVRRSEPSRESCEVRTIIADAVGLAEIDAERHRIRIVVEPLIDLPNFWADPILIAQVLLNLMKNAIEAMRSDGQRLHSPREPSLRLAVSVVGHQLEFMVADTGPGVSQELQDRLFEPFYTTKSEGMGMGLNICRTIVEFHEGRLWVESAEPTGCVFRFTLPLAEAYQEVEESTQVAL